MVNLEKGVASCVVEATNAAVLPVRFEYCVRWLGFDTESNMTKPRHDKPAVRRPVALQQGNCENGWWSLQQAALPRCKGGEAHSTLAFAKP